MWDLARTCYLRNLTIDMLVNQSIDTWLKTIIGRRDEVLGQNRETKTPSIQ